MAVNKVVYSGQTLVDLTSDSVTPETLAEGVTAHNASGEQITGTMQAAKPTQFVNVLEYADSLEINTRFASNGSYNTSTPKSIIAVTLDLNKLPSGINLKNNTNEFRFRGCTHIDAAFAMSSDGVTYSSKGLDCGIKRVDEYGDAVFQRGYISDRYVRFNIGMSSMATSSNSALADDFDPLAFGCIVTFNQPIGNGGYTG